MKKTALTLASVAVLGTLVGCAYRDATMYRDETSKVLASKSNEIQACYDGVLKGTPGAGGKVTVNFEVETEEGKIQNVEIDKANTNAPEALGECVKRSIAGLIVAPPDRKLGQATYVYEFSVGPTPKS
jgi:hypothetical protein